MFSPALIPGTNYRIDTFLIYILLPLIVLRNQKIRFISTNIQIIFALTLFVFSIFISLFLQIFIIDNPSFTKHAINFAGFSRLLLFGLLAFVTINTYTKAIKITKLLLYCTIIQSIIIIIHYSQVYPFADIINMLYSHSVYSPYLYRATGTFATVHAAAYFFLYSSLFSITIYISVKNERLKKLSILAILFSFIGVILPVSKGAYIALFLSLLYLAISLKIYKTIFKSFVFMIILFSFFLFLIPEKKLDYFIKDIGQLYDGISWFFFSTTNSYDEIGFISGRLNHGWKNAIDNWLEYPIHGNLDSILFTGDGGYTEILSNSGLIGFLGFLLMLIILFLRTSFFIKHKSSGFIKNIGLRLFVIAILFASIATGFVKERTIELLPIIFLTLSTLSSKTNSINTCNKILKLS